LYNNINRIDLYINLKSYNIKTKQFESYTKPFYFIMDPKFTFYAQMALRISKSRINTGFLFSNINEDNYVSDASITTQTLT